MQQSAKDRYTYRIGKGNPTNPIKRLEVISKTDKTVTFRESLRTAGNREGIDTGYHIHFPTLEEAKTYCIKQCEGAIRQAELKILSCQKRLEELKQEE
jgi:hypothetical protein